LKWNLHKSNEQITQCVDVKYKRPVTKLLSETSRNGTVLTVNTQILQILQNQLNMTMMNKKQKKLLNVT